MAAEGVSKVAQVVMDGNAVTSILNNINTLYSAAVSQLITYTIGMMAFVGVLLPVVISLLQSRQLKADQANLTQKLEAAIVQAKTSLSEQIKADLKEEMATYEARIAEIKDGLTEDIKRAKDEAVARTHHLQAISLIGKGLFVDALADCANAAPGYASCGHEQNLQIILDVVGDTILPKLNRSHFENTNAEESLGALFEAFEPLDENKRYRRYKEKLTAAIKSARARPAPN